MNIDNQNLLIVVLVLGIGLVVTGSFSGLGDDTPRMDDCPPQPNGDLNCNIDNQDDGQIDRNSFDISIVDISGSGHSPVDRFLYEQGFIDESDAFDDENEGYDPSGYNGYTISDGGVVFNQSIKERIEEASTCQAVVTDATSDSSFRFTVDGSQEYRWESDDDTDDQAPSISEIDFGTIQIQGDVSLTGSGYVECRNLEYTDVVEAADDRFTGEITSYSRIPNTELTNLGVKVDFDIASKDEPNEDSKDGNEDQYTTPVEPPEENPVYSDPSPTPEEPIETPSEPERKSIFNLILDILVFWN